VLSDLLFDSMQTKYKRMIKGLIQKESALKKSYPIDQWALYILKCNDGTFYTGITNDIDRRMQMHSKGTASKYTRSRVPVKLIYTESCTNRASALIREYEIKSLSRKAKEKLVKTKKTSQTRKKSGGN